MHILTTTINLPSLCSLNIGNNMISYLGLVLVPDGRLCNLKKLCMSIFFISCAAATKIGSKGIQLLIRS